MTRLLGQLIVCLHKRELKKLFEKERKGKIDPRELIRFYGLKGNYFGHKVTILLGKNSYAEDCLLERFERKESAAYDLQRDIYAEFLIA